MAGNLTAMIASIFSGSAVTPDPYFEYTTLLLPGNGTNGATNNTFLDGSTNNFTITRNGNTTQGTFSPFSQTGWGNYFNGSSRLSSSTGNVLNWGTNNFTVEMWVYLTTTSSNMMLLEGPSNNDFQLFVESGILKAGFGGAGVSVSYTLPSTFANTWNHIAVVRSGTSTNQTALYVNGVSQSTGTWSSSGAATGFQIARTSAYTLYGYVSGVRVIQNQALTSGNFTPPTAQVTTSSVGWTGANVAGSVTGTVSLLLCTSNRFVDSSGTVSTITIGGSPTVVAFSPFNPTASWSAATNGGSGYFDGSGDYLQLPAGTAFAPGTGDFTVDGWFYTTVTTANQIIWSQAVSGTNYFIVWADPSTSTVYFNGTLSGGGVNISSTANLQVNAWNYFSVRRASGTVTVYLNGVAGTGTSNTVDFSNTSYVPTIGRYTHSATNQFQGYISNLRYVNGTAIAPSGVPTAPSTAVSGTSALLNFTNAGIYDATSKNDLETVGNAQISTAQSKWGGSSMSFDGTGDYLQTLSTDLYNFGTGEFTIEAWVYLTSLPQVATIIDTRNGDVLGAYDFAVTASQKLDFLFASSGTTRITSTNNVSLNTWTHVVVSRASGTLRLFINGNQEASTSTSAAINALSFPSIGGGRSGGTNVVNGYYLNGYIQDLRITKGYARYVGGTGDNAGKMVFNGTNTLALPTAAFPTL